MQGFVKKTAIISFSGLMQSAMLAATGLSSSMAWLLPACFCLGLAGGWIDNGANSSMIDLHRQDGAKYMGFLHGFYGVGAILTPLLIQGLLFVTDWRHVYFFCAALTFLIALQFFIVTKRHRSVFQRTSDRRNNMTAAQMKTFMKDRYSVLVVLATMLYSASQTIMLSWMVRFMSVRYDAATLGSLAVSLIWGMSTVSRFFAPLLGIKPLRLVFWGLSVSVVLILAGVLSGNPYVMLITSALTGLVTGQTLPMLISETVSRFPENTVLPTSIVLLSTKIAMGFAPLLVGMVSAMLTISAGMLTASLFSALSAFAAFLAMRVGPHNVPTRASEP
jgi:fucose permease